MRKRSITTHACLQVHTFPGDTACSYCNTAPSLFRNTTSMAWRMKYVCTELHRGKHMTISTAAGAFSRAGRSSERERTNASSPTRRADCAPCLQRLHERGIRPPKRCHQLVAIRHWIGCQPSVWHTSAISCSPQAFAAIYTTTPERQGSTVTVRSWSSVTGAPKLTPAMERPLGHGCRRITQR